MTNPSYDPQPAMVRERVLEEKIQSLEKRIIELSFPVRPLIKFADQHGCVATIGSDNYEVDNEHNEIRVVLPYACRLTTIATFPPVKFFPKFFNWLRITLFHMANK